MNNLFWGYQHRTSTCEIYQNITIQRIELCEFTPPHPRLHTQLWHHQLLMFDEFNVLPHTIEWSAFIYSANQYAD